MLCLPVLWVVTIMNSLNMLDNMDGITGTTVTFILISCLLSSFIIFELNRNIWSIILVAQIGALIGFLYYNVNPSKLFMGDAGSQYIGLVVSFFSIKFLLNVGSLIAQPKWIGLIICLIAFTPAAVDSLTVTINRIKSGRSPMVGGKDHTTHHLVYAGLTDKQVWYVFYL
jgi:UDP-GlcNAc:undecaprenyl-phosphate/decaprenyl-phosphate GlcNAc-1-phosphate transferase